MSSNSNASTGFRVQIFFRTESEDLFDSIEIIVSLGGTVDHVFRQYYVFHGRTSVGEYITAANCQQNDAPRTSGPGYG